MSRARIVILLAFAASTLAFVQAPAGAAAPAANGSAFCKPITGLSDKLKNAGADTSKFGTNTFKQFATALQSSAKQAPATNPTYPEPTTAMRMQSIPGNLPTAPGSPWRLLENRFYRILWRR